MKDAYSFDLSDEEAKKSYNKMFFAYLNTFKRLGLKAIPMTAATGPIGGDLSHEFIILAETGESKIYSDKRILDISIDDYINNEDSIKKLRSKYNEFYAATDDKFKKEDFEKEVKKENQLITKGIEVGHIFYFGDKYSKSMNAAVDFKGKKEFVKMGSYGIGVSRLVGAIIEAKYDDKQEIMKWPLSVAPYDCAILPLVSKNDNTNLEKANNIFEHFKNKQIDTIIDDTVENFSAKIKKFNLIGIPYQILIGKRTEGDLFEFKEIGKDSKNLTIKQIADIIINKKKTN